MKRNPTTCVYAAVLMGWVLMSQYRMEAAFSVRSERFTLHSWNREDGLPSDAAERLLATRDGWLWIGTRSGLARFDGMRFTVYDGRTPGFTSDAILELAEDAGGDLWIGTKKGLYRKRGGQFSRFTTAEGLPHNQINQVYAGQEGPLWIATLGGVARLGAEGIRNDVDPGPDFEPRSGGGERNDVICLAPDGRVWVLGTPDGLREFDPVSGKRRLLWRPSVTSEFDRSGIIQRLWRDPDGTLWVGTETAIHRQTAHGWKSFPFPPGAGDLRCRQLRRGADGRLWAVRGGELFEVRPPKVIRVAEAETMAAAHITDVLPDVGGALWVATRFAGLHRLTPSMIRVLTTRDGLPHNNVTSVYPAREGGVWVGTLHGVTRWNGARFETPAAEVPLSRLSAQSVFEDRSGDLWIGFSTSSGSGCLWLEREGNSYRQLHFELGVDHPSVFGEDRSGRMWILGREGISCLLTNYLPRLAKVNLQKDAGDRGLHHHRKRASRWQSKGAEFQHMAGDYWHVLATDYWRPHVNPEVAWLPLNSLPALDAEVLPFPWELLRLPSVAHRAFLETKEGQIWVGTWGGGILRFRGVELARFDRTAGLPSDRVHCLHVYNGRLMAGTERGLAEYLEGSGRWRPVPIDCGFPDLQIRQLVSDREGNLWFGSNEGIGRIDRDDWAGWETGRFHKVDAVLLDSADGLLASQTSAGAQPSACLDAEGRLCFATPQGLAILDPRQPMLPRFPPRPFITHLRAGDRLHSTLDSESTPPGETTRPLALPPGSGRSIALEYTGVEFATPGRVAFRYRLGGHDRDWIEAGSRRAAFYTNLRPGDYQFAVEARGRSGGWVQAAPLFIAIAPFIWETEWFRAVVALAGGGVLAMTLRWRLGHVRKLERAEAALAVAREREAIARDLHDDLGSRLTQISLLGELTARDSTRTSEVAALARETALSLDHLVWTVHPERDSLRQLAAYLSQTSHELLAPAGLRLEQSFPKDLPDYPVSPATRKAVLLAVKEALTNVIKHARASCVRFTLELRSGAIVLTIEDNGCGGAQPLSTASADARSGIPNRENSFDARLDSATRGHGLENIRRRLAEIGGRAEVDVRLGGGTRVTLEAPMPLHSS